MGEQSNRQVVERYVNALVDDLDTLEDLQHPDFIEEFPQSGERIRGRENFRKIHENYPEGTPEVARSRALVGSEDRWVTTPSFTLLRVAGSGDIYTYVANGLYPDGSEWYSISLIEMRDGKIFKSTTYFAQPFEAPEWRSKWVEKI